LKTWFNASYFFRDAQIDVKETAKGFHVRIFVANTVVENLDVRRSLGDDVRRIEYDEKRSRCPMLVGWVDTLFNAKWRGGKMVSEEKPCNIFSEAFVTRLPARKPPFSLG